METRARARAHAHTQNIHARTHTNIQHLHTRTGENPLTTIYVNIETCNHNYIIILIVIYDHYFTILSYTVVSRVVPNSDSVNALLQFHRRTLWSSRNVRVWENSPSSLKYQSVEEDAAVQEKTREHFKCRSDPRLSRAVFLYLYDIHWHDTEDRETRWGRESSRSRWRAAEHY